MILWKLIVGIILIVAAVGSVIASISRTPDNLQGFYGAMFWIISLAGILGGIILSVTAFI